jgi:hypothetical protein
MLCKSLSAGVYGMEAGLVEVEVEVGSGNWRDFSVVGLPDGAVKEAASASRPRGRTAASIFRAAERDDPYFAGWFEMVSLRTEREG